MLSAEVVLFPPSHFFTRPQGPSIFTATLDFPGITQASRKRRERVLRSGAARPIIASDAPARTGDRVDKESDREAVDKDSARKDNSRR
jgi:hypothetical protein